MFSPSIDWAAIGSIALTILLIAVPTAVVGIVAAKLVRNR